MDTSTLFLDMFFGVLGLSYCVYGKKQEHMVALISGVMLGIFPFFITNVWLTLLVGTILGALPFVINE